ncbi:MAG: tripartite tricarboxylate transporter substrate binding protein [Xanthobacteraceae bacterium]|nr:tripartite tricarboxylate transporter substrate binding protein [Xanthobacteraceae bacterium]
MTGKSRLLFVLSRWLLAAVAAPLAAPAHAQDWPAKPVRIVVPYAAGGNSDSMARLTAQRFTETFGQQFVVENRLGANGAIAADAVARATADGYTLLWGVQPALTIAPAMNKVNFDSQKDFAPISVVGTNPFVLVVNKTVPATTVAEFVAWVKSQPAKLSYAEGSAGSMTHLSMALFLKRAGLDMSNVSYRGNAPALTDVIAGHLPAMMSNLSDALPHAQGGAIRLLAVTSEARIPQLPQLPTVAELGYPGYKAVTWNGLMAPAGTPKPIIDKMAAEIAQACKDPKFLERLATLGTDPSGITPAQFAELIAADLKQWAEAVAAAGVKQQ